MTAKRRLLFVQGGGEGTHDEWDAKLVASLSHELGTRFAIDYPRMPHEDNPSYAPWKAALVRAIGKLPDDAVLVGHSVGGTILLKLLTEDIPDRKVGAIILIAAPYVGDGGWAAQDMQFPADVAAHLPAGADIHFFHGLADEIVPASHVELYARMVPHARVHRLPGRDHQLNTDLKEVAAVLV